MTTNIEDALKLVKLALVSIADEADAAKSQQLAKEVLAVVEGVMVQPAPVLLLTDIISALNEAAESLSDSARTPLADELHGFALMLADAHSVTAKPVKGTQA
jgi:RecB family exonuclease